MEMERLWLGIEDFLEVCFDQTVSSLCPSEIHFCL